ncbi:MAG: energy transducer TonB [Terriglobales bacterium]
MNATVYFGIALGLGSFASAQNTVTLKHIEFRQGYSRLARSAQLQGKVVVHLKISSSGTVSTAEPETSEQNLVEHPLLQEEASNIARKCTFQCLDCTRNGDYSYTLIFVYRLEGQKSKFDESKISFDFPSTITITAHPPVSIRDTEILGRPR